MECTDELLRSNVNYHVKFVFDDIFAFAYFLVQTHLSQNKNEHDCVFLNNYELIITLFDQGLAKLYQCQFWENSITSLSFTFTQTVSFFGVQEKDIIGILRDIFNHPQYYNSLKNNVIVYYFPKLQNVQEILFFLSLGYKIFWITVEGSDLEFFIIGRAGSNSRNMIISRF